MIHQEMMYARRSGRTTAYLNMSIMSMHHLLGALEAHDKFKIPVKSSIVAIRGLTELTLIDGNKHPLWEPLDVPVDYDSPRYVEPRELDGVKNLSIVDRVHIQSIMHLLNLLIPYGRPVVERHREEGLDYILFDWSKTTDIQADKAFTLLMIACIRRDVKYRTLATDFSEKVMAVMGGLVDYVEYFDNVLRVYIRVNLNGPLRMTMYGLSEDYMIGLCKYAELDKILRSPLTEI